MPPPPRSRAERERDERGEEATRHRWNVSGAVVSGSVAVVPDTAKFLTPEWVDLVRTSAESRQLGAGGTRRVQMVVTGRPRATSMWHLQVDAAKVDVGLGPVVDADVVLTLRLCGRGGDPGRGAAAERSFMQGRMKTAGDPGRLLDLLAATASPAFSDARAGIAAATEV